MGILRRHGSLLAVSLVSRGQAGNPFVYLETTVSDDVHPKFKWGNGTTLGQGRPRHLEVVAQLLTGEKQGPSVNRRRLRGECSTCEASRSSGRSSGSLMIWIAAISTRLTPRSAATRGAAAVGVFSFLGGMVVTEGCFGSRRPSLCPPTADLVNTLARSNFLRSVNNVAPTLSVSVNECAQKSGMSVNDCTPILVVIIRKVSEERHRSS